MTISFGDSKRPFLAAIVVLSIIAVGLMIAVIVLAIPKKSIKEEYCYKSNCLKAASELLDSIDTSVPPCTDFYKHVCGKWISDNKIPPDQTRVGVFTNVQNVVTERLSGLLFEKLDAKAASAEVTAVSKARTFFKSCMDMRSIEQNSVNKIRDFYNLIKNKTNLEDLVSFLLEYDISVLLPYGVSTDPKNVTRNLIVVASSDIIMKIPMYYNRTNAVFPKFKNLIKGISDILMQNFTDNVIDFEWKWKDNRPERSMDESNQYNLKTIKELKNLTKDQVDWLEIFKRAVKISGSKAKLDENTIVLVQYPKYITELVDILKATDIETLANYAVTRFIIQNINAMPAKLNELQQEFEAMSSSSARKNVCVGSVNNLMPNAISRLYIDNYFPESSKKLAVQLVLAVQKAMEKIFKATKWMDTATRKAAIDKVQNVLPFIGYDAALKDDKALNKHFKGITFSNDTFLQNLIDIAKMKGEASFSALGDINTRSSENWKSIGAAIVDAFYSPQMNGIIFPAGILQSPLYNAEYPLSMLFGAMGAVVGHELTHGFDTSGAQFDEIGNLRNWWTAASMKNFQKRAAGLKKQYKDFPICKNVPGCHIHINENQTIGENIADTGGVKASQMAYQEYVKSHGIKQKLLPGLSYTSDQLFYVAFAHVWCRKIRPAALVEQLMTDNHSPEMARVIVTLRNSESFAEAFNCKKNAPMNPEPKYGVW